MNILIVHPCKGFYGGAEEVVVQLCKYLVGQKHEVVLAVKDPPKGVYGNFPRKVYYYTTSSFWGLRRLTQMWLGWADVVNVHNFPATLTTFPKEVPTVYMCNEPAELFTNWKRKPIEAFNRWWVRKSGMEVVVADQMNAGRFTRIYGVKPTIVPYGVDYEFWSKGVAFQRNKTVRLLQVGTISPYKNQLKSICLLAELLSEGVDAMLTLAGGIGDKEYYDRLVNDYIPYINKEEVPGFNHRVFLLGQQTQEQIRDLYSSHDLLFHPVEGQGGWLVPFEAMCASLPVIVEPEFSASDLIQSNHLGIVSGDRGFIAARAILDKEYEKVNTERAKEWVRDNLTWEKFGERMVGVFEGVGSDK